MESNEGVVSSEGDSEKPLLYHHARPLEFVTYGIATQKLNVDEYFDSAYKWLEKEVGFAPLFMAVGATPDDKRMTGYQSNWQRLLSWSSTSREYTKKGEFPNQVLFSYKDIPHGVFTDFDDWHRVLNTVPNGEKVNRWEQKLIFRKTWNKEKWIEKAMKNPHTVQLVVPNLDLRKADKISVRNKQTKAKLEAMGFGNVVVERLSVSE